MMREIIFMNCSLGIAEIKNNLSQIFVSQTSQPFAKATSMKHC